MLLTDRYRRKAHNAAWYDSPNDKPSNLPLAVRNPFGKRNPTRSHNDQHVQETGDVHLPKLTAIRTDGQDYRSRERREEFGVDEQKQHSATTPNVTSAPDFRTADLKIPRRDSPAVEETSVDKVEQVPERREHGSTSSETAICDEVRNKSPLDANHEGTHHRNVGALEKVKFWGKSKDTSDGNDDPDAKKKEKRVYTPMSQVRATILNSWINVLLIACWFSHPRAPDTISDVFLAPVGIALYYAHVNPVAVFVVNFIAIIPLAAMLSYATEEIAYRTGETIGGLLNASFGLVLVLCRCHKPQGADFFKATPSNLSSPSSLSFRAKL
jgi:Ca2+:H+ antiporter